MQKRNEIVFGDIDDVYMIADDIIVAARNEKEHDAIMLSLLNRAKENGVCFNRDKIQFKVNSIRCMGHLITTDGLKTDDEKINAIVNIPPPTDVSSLQRRLGMTKYLVVVWSGTQSQSGPAQIKARSEGLSFYHNELLCCPD